MSLLHYCDHIRSSLVILEIACSCNNSRDVELRMKGAVSIAAASALYYQQPNVCCIAPSSSRGRRVASDGTNMPCTTVPPLHVRCKRTAKDLSRPPGEQRDLATKPPSQHCSSVLLVMVVRTSLFTLVSVAPRGVRPRRQYSIHPSMFIRY